MKKLFIKFRHLVEYILFLLFIYIFKIFGMDKSASICAYIAKKIGPLLPATAIAKRNINNVLGTEIDQDKFIADLWDNFGRFIGEFPDLGSLSEEEITKRIELVGLEYTEKLQKLNQPFLLFTGHFANWDIALKVVSKFYPKFGVAYRKANNPYVNELIKNFRKTNDIRLIAKGPYGAKDLLKSFKQKESIVMLVDQRMREGIEVPFFGKSAMTANAIAKFALQFNYPIVPCQIIRKKGSYFKLIIHEPLKFDISGDTTKDCYNIMLNINKILEAWVRENPTQWLWFHNRWGKNNK